MYYCPKSGSLQILYILSLVDETQKIPGVFDGQMGVCVKCVLVVAFCRQTVRVQQVSVRSGYASKAGAGKAKRLENEIKKQKNVVKRGIHHNTNLMNFLVSSYLS